MKSTLKIISLLALFCVAVPCLTLAADKADKKPDASKAKGKFTPLYAQVESITPALLTVKGTGPELKFVINGETKITKDKAHKEAAATTDVKVGQWIGGSYTKGPDGNVLHSLHLAVNQKGDKAEKPAK